MSSHRWIPAMLLLFSTVLHELSGSAEAGITVGLGGVAPGFFSPFNQTMMGSVQPIRKIELTDRNCDPNALSRIADDRICNKYYVCFNGKYAGLYCPTGMAFDYGLQECHFKVRVDCSRREFISAGTLTTTETSVTTPDPMGTIPPIPQPATTTPQSLTMKPAPVRLPTQSVLTSPHRRPVVSPIEQQVTKTTGVSGNVMTLSLGAKVMIPFGSTIFLPAGSQIQVESLSPSDHQPKHHSGHHSGRHQHHHRRASTPVDGIASPDRDGDPIPTLTRNSSDGIDMANDARSDHHQATDVGDDMPISDYDYDDQSVVPDNKAEDGSIDVASFRDDIQ